MDGKVLPVGPPPQEGVTEGEVYTLGRALRLAVGWYLKAVSDQDASEQEEQKQKYDSIRDTLCDLALGDAVAVIEYEKRTGKTGNDRKNAESAHRRILEILRRK